MKAFLEFIRKQWVDLTGGFISQLTSIVIVISSIAVAVIMVGPDFFPHPFKHGVGDFLIVLLLGIPFYLLVGFIGMFMLSIFAHFISQFIFLVFDGYFMEYDESIHKRSKELTFIIILLILLSWLLPTALKSNGWLS